MRYLSILQVIFGSIIIFFSWTLADSKAHIYPYIDPVMNGDSPVIFTNTRPPDAILEFTLLSLSLIVFICGWLQWKANIRGSLSQIILGWIIIVLYLILSIRAATLGYGEISGIYYLAYASLALGFVICIIGLVQAIKTIRDNLKARSLIS